MTLKDPQAPGNNEEVVDDRRAAIEAAFEAAEKTEPATPTPAAQTESVQGELSGTAKPAAGAETASPSEDAAKAAELADKAGAEASGKKDETDHSADRAPQSWKPAEKAKWAQLDPDIRKEVLRREGEITRTLSETAQARQFTQQFQQAIQPFMARIQTTGAHPIAVVQELLKADHLLSTAPKNQRAQFMAQLISDYDVDIEALDAALSGKPVEDPVDSKVEQLLQKRLAPFNTFIQQQQEQFKRTQEEQTAKATQTIEAMAKDPKFPHFEAVRETMADLIEFFATKKNILLEPEEAYNKAVMSDPVLSKQIQAQSTAAAQAAQAQRAKNASVSVSGAPRAQMAGSPAATDRRAIIAAAFDQHAGR